MVSGGDGQSICECAYGGARRQIWLGGSGAHGRRRDSRRRRRRRRIDSGVSNFRRSERARRACQKVKVAIVWSVTFPVGCMEKFCIRRRARERAGERALSSSWENREEERGRKLKHAVKYRYF